MVYCTKFVANAVLICIKLTIDFSRNFWFFLLVVDKGLYIQNETYQLSRLTSALRRNCHYSVSVHESITEGVALSFVNDQESVLHPQPKTMGHR